MNEQPTHIDLCAGIGGFSIAAEWAGFRTIGFAEIADYPSRILAQYWPGVPNWGDIRNTPAVRCNLLTAGDPCQPFSVAGRRQGEADDRYIWPAVLDAIGRHEPDWCLLENVVGIKGMVLSRRLDDLEARGYEPQAFDIPSCAVGLPSVERHIWIVAASNALRLSRFTQERVSGRVFTESAYDPKPIAGICERPDLFEPKLCRSRKGIPNFVERIAGLGNAIPPPVAYEILRIIRTLLP